MNWYLWANIITAVGALGGFIYGGVLFFRPRKAVYAQMITFAVGCMAFGRIYQVIRMLTIHDISSQFHLGFLGVIGSLLFLFSANYGAMDGLVDDKSKELRKYRIIPLAAPVLFLAIYLIFFLFSDQPLRVKIMAGVITVNVMHASYFNLKHLIFPDVEYGVINCLKGYNLLALIFELLCVAEMLTMSRDFQVLTFVIGILMGVILPMMVIAVNRGGKKWSA